MEQYSIDNFNEYVQKHNTTNEIVAYFKNFNTEYKKLKKDKKVTEELLDNLTEFWIDATDRYGESLIYMLQSHWGDSTPTVIKDIVANTTHYHKTKYEGYITKLDNIELKELDLLFHCIWDRGIRTEINYSYLDYDGDFYYENNLLLPRNNREELEYSFKIELAKYIYNRGNMFIKFFSGRGKFDIVGVKVNGKGIWRCMAKEEIEQEYIDADGNYYTFTEDEKVVEFKVNHCLRQNTEGNVIYYEFK